MQDVAEIVKPGSGFYVEGRGVVDLEEETRHRELARVIQRHDPERKLTIGRHKESGEWVLFLRPSANPFGIDAPHPILGLGKELPSPEMVDHILEQTDTRKHGDKILKDIHATNARLQAPARSRADDAQEQLAEAMESFMHAQGKTPYFKSMRNMDPRNAPYRKDA